MFDITQFREDIVAPALNAVGIRSPEYVELLVFTCAVESAGGTYVKQIQGPALGIYQIEPNTFTDIWHNYILRKPDIVNMLSLNLGIHRIPAPLDLITNLSLSSVMCAMIYKARKVNPVDSNPETLWSLYKEFYNTPAGKAEHDACMKAYKKFTKQ